MFRKELLMLSQFCLKSETSSNWPPKSFVPNNVKIKVKIVNKTKMLMKLIKQEESTVIITFINSNERSNLVILSTLRVLKDYRLTIPERTISITEIITMKQSKSFIGSRRYPIGPNASTLIISSTIKTQVKQLFKLIKNST